MAKANKRPIAAMNAPDPVAEFITFVDGILACLELYPDIFADIDPPVDVAKDHLKKLRTAQAKALTKLIGSSSSRDICYNIVVHDMNSILKCVQVIADDMPTESAKIAVISCSGFDLKGRGVRIKAPLKVMDGTISGTAKLIAKALAKHCIYLWEVSTDCENWISATPTTQAKTIIYDLTPGVKYFFRYCAIIRKVQTDWSNPVEMIVR